MRHSSWRVCAAVILIFLWGALCSPSCPSSCLCQGGSLINCSSVGPTLLPLHFPVSVTILDLSRNGLSSLPFRPYRTPLPHLTHLHLGHNQLTHLSLCEAPPREAGLCETWAPTLELLSAERNQLQHIPEGVCGSTFLHVLSLSHNRISILRDQDLQGCAHLRELHLQHNLITALTPLAFRQMHKLRILDLSFNTLSTFPMLAYLSLRSLNTQVEVSSNPWKCDCRLQALRRWMGVARDSPPWQVVCEEPPGVAGRDLLHLDDTDLTCNTPEEGVGLHQEVTVHLGAEILLPCWVSDQDLSRAFWWTPNGSVRQASAEHGGGLLIPGVRERDQGLYMCVSGATQEPAVMFTVHVRGGAEPALRGGDRTRADLTLAVCLSVFLTFIAAFALGTGHRPDWTARRGTLGRSKAAPGPFTRTSPPQGTPPHSLSQCQASRPPGGRGQVPGGVELTKAARVGTNQIPPQRKNPAHPRHTVEFEPIPDPQGLGIEEHSTSGSEPDCDLEPDRVHLSDPFPISRDEFTAGWSSSTPPPGEDPFPAPDWTDSPWEPHPSAAQAPPPDSFPPELDAELWNDSGESFEFPDSLHDEATRGGSSLAQQLKEGPWSPFYQSAPEELGSHDPTLQEIGELKDAPFQKDVPQPRLTGDAPWVIHVAGYADADTDLTRFESPGAWPPVTHDTEGRGHSPEPRRSFSRGTTEQEEAQGAWPVEEVGPVSQRQDWRRGGLFFQKKIAMDTFAPTSQAPPLPGSAHLLYDSVTEETVTMAADNTKSTSEWLPLGEEEMSVGGGRGG
ncbi:hypothetical protein SKAU_G00421400 [Synaphobranchus kaupii]|uniref:Ig-like domain-containing protein n=1 Tax=Synaphobranchus kaupii TaxID=118154 RepID=A0A9Q1E6P7_SYNKA|nr:hypothetical protein SKAU_G00421400 [Synaphobranchus kaupii]